MLHVAPLLHRQLMPKQKRRDEHKHKHMIHWTNICITNTNDMDTNDTNHHGYVYTGSLMSHQSILSGVLTSAVITPLVIIIIVV